MQKEFALRINIANFVVSIWTTQSNTTLAGDYISVIKKVVLGTADLAPFVVTRNKHLVLGVYITSPRLSMRQSLTDRAVGAPFVVESTRMETGWLLIMITNAVLLVDHVQRAFVDYYATNATLGWAISMTI